MRTLVVICGFLSAIVGCYAAMRPSSLSTGPFGPSSIYSDTTVNFVNPVSPGVGQTVRIGIRTAHGLVDQVVIRIWDGSEHLVTMSRSSGSTRMFDHWQGSFKIGKPGLIWYRFLLPIDGRAMQYNVAGLKPVKDDEGDFVIATDFTTPRWAAEAVFYQIFPDRFFDGDVGNNVQENEYPYLDQKVFTHKNWAEQPRYQADFFGGDIRGIKNKLDYLQHLGITALYLNPVFQSRSNHKYDTQDYDTIDPHFGTNDQFKAFVDELHRPPFGMKIILDGVFNHTGETHRWFDAKHLYPHEGAFESKTSPFADFFVFNDWPDDYLSWWGYKTLPKLNYDSPGLRKAIYEGGKDSVIGRWIAEFGIDGWRLDVPNDLNEDPKHGFKIGNHQIWREVRKVVKSLSNDALISGEIWINGQPWLGGDQFDSLMNYHGFTHPLSKLLTGYDCQSDQPAKGYSLVDFERDLRFTRNLYPLASVQAQQNSISTHDIPRFLRRSTGMQRKDKHYNDISVTSERPDLMAQAVFFQMTYVGAPMVYYGDEIGLTGGADPDNRRTFDWKMSSANAKNLLSLHRSLIAIRKTHPALIDGSFLTLALDDPPGVFAYARVLDGKQGERLVAVINFSDSKRHTTISLASLDLDTPLHLKNLFTYGSTLDLDKNALTVDLDPRGMALVSIK